MMPDDLNGKPQLPEDVESVREKVAWERLRTKLKPVQIAFRKEYRNLSNDEVQAMIDNWIDEANITR